MKTVNPLTYMISPTTTFTDEEHAQQLLEELLEDGHDVDEMKELSKLTEQRKFYEKLRRLSPNG